MIRLPPPPPLVLPPQPRYRLTKEGFDRLRVDIPNQVLTRQEAFRLIGELERLAQSL